MNIVIWAAIAVTLFGVGFILWDRKNSKKNWEKVIVSYSEVIGDGLIEHEKQYEGKVNLTDDIFKIKLLHLIMPIPPINSFIPTKGGAKKVYLIKLDASRFGFRVVNMDNTVFVHKRDDYGNLIKKNGKPLLIKHKWKYCDDVVEPDVKHWDENIKEKLKQKHKTRADMLSKWIAPLIVGLIMVSGIVAIHMTTKYAGETFDKVQTTAEATAQVAKENTGMISNLIKKVEDRESSGGGG